jgi:hypothetical protein
MHIIRLALTEAPHAMATMMAGILALESWPALLGLACPSAYNRTVTYLHLLTHHFGHGQQSRWSTQLSSSPVLLSSLLLCVLCPMRDRAGNVRAQASGSWEGSQSLRSHTRQLEVVRENLTPTCGMAT